MMLNTQSTVPQSPFTFSGDDSETHQTFFNINQINQPERVEVYPSIKKDLSPVSLVVIDGKLYKISSEQESQDIPNTGIFEEE